MLRSTLAATALMLAVTTPHSAAFALEGKALLDSFIADAADMGVKLRYETLSEDGSSFTMGNVVVTNARGRDIAIDQVNVQNLQDAGSGRVSYDSIVVNGMTGPTDSGGQVAVQTIATTNGEWPVTIWRDGLTAEEKKQRIRFGSFTVNGVAVKDKGANTTLDTLSVLEADIPLDYRYDPQSAKLTEPVAGPLRVKGFSISGLGGTAQGDVSWSIGGITLADLNMPTAMSAFTADTIRTYSGVSLTDIAFKMAGLDVFSIASISGAISEPSDDGTLTGTSNMSGLYANLKAITDPQSRAVFEQLGYETVEGSLTGVGSYNPDTGFADVSQMTLTLTDMFDLDFTYAMQGYTLDVIRKLNEASLSIESGTPIMEAYGAILPELANLKLSDLKLSLKDRSLTGRALDFQASQMGTTGDQLAQGAPMMIGMGMAGLQMPGLTDMVTRAVGDFLRDKGTLNVEAKPAEPVSLINLILTGQSNPTRIPEMLNLQVSATPQ
ncbi:MAG: hypothetical protein AAGI12_03710 [Pseudomonadota bacterium]